MAERVEQLNFLSPLDVEQVANSWGTPVFVYDEATLSRQANEALGFYAPYGLTVRYAMKANPNRHILAIFDRLGLEIDASTGFDAERAIRAGVDPKTILITSQELPKNLETLVAQGVQFNACSLHQLDEYGTLFLGTQVGVRINPGRGSGHSNKTNVGGPASSFGIWHEYVGQVKKIAVEHGLTINRLHTHIGSGSDPQIWLSVAKMSLEQVHSFPDVEILNLGGGFKIARTQQERRAGTATDMQAIGRIVAGELERFNKETGRKLHLEIEPGTLLVANAGSLVTTIHDIVDTGKQGYSFLKIDSGMTEIIRPNLYGAQHPLVVVNENHEHKKYVVVGHCCESGDLLTPCQGDPEAISTRLLKKAKIGNRLVVEGVGAYCASMSAKNYNSFPLRPEVLRKGDGTFVEICRRESLDEMLALETQIIGFP
jgi:diaminopimelate decarboxylase